MGLTAHEIHANISKMRQFNTALVVRCSPAYFFHNPETKILITYLFEILQIPTTKQQE